MRPRLLWLPDLRVCRSLASPPSGAQGSRPRSGAAEHAVDVVLSGVPAIFGKLRPVEETAIVTGIDVERDRRELLDVLPDREQPRDVLLDKLQRLEHMADALAGQVLEIAGLENLHDALLDVMDE